MTVVSSAQELAHVTSKRLAFFIIFYWYKYIILIIYRYFLISLVKKSLIIPLTDCNIYTGTVDFDGSSP